MRTLTLASIFVALSSSLASAQPAKLDPCAILTQAEIKAAVGIEIGKLAVNPNMNPSAGTLCDFQIGEVGAGGIALRTMPASETPAKILAETKAHKISTADAPGIGAGAFFTSPGYGMVQIIAFKGSTQVMIQLMAMGTAEAKLKGAAEQLARTALGRLK